MTASQHYARIAISLPPEDLVEADRLAQALNRSRSWVMAEALRQFVAQQGSATLPRLDPSRRAQPRRDLALTAEQRIRDSEDTAELRVTSNDPRRFQSFDEFAAWRSSRRVTG
jgi:hypothetical protein